MSSSNNNFGHLSPGSPPLFRHPSIPVIVVQEPAELLNVVLHTIYGMSCQQFGPPLRTLLEAIKRLDMYGASIRDLLRPSCPLFSHILTLATHGGVYYGRRERPQHSRYIGFTLSSLIQPGNHNRWDGGSYGSNLFEAAILASSREKWVAEGTPSHSSGAAYRLWICWSKSTDKGLGFSLRWLSMGHSTGYICRRSNSTGKTLKYYAL